MLWRYTLTVGTCLWNTNFINPPYACLSASQDWVSNQHLNMTRSETFLAATKQLYEWFSPSVRLSVCPSHLLMFPSLHHHEIFRSYYTSDVHAKGQGHRSKVKVTEVMTQLNHFRIVTPVWIHMWWWNDAYSLIMLRRGVLLFLKVIRQISMSHGSKNRQIWPRLGVSGL